MGGGKCAMGVVTAVKRSHWQRRGKPVWAAERGREIAAGVENLAVKVPRVDAHVSKIWATEEHQNNQQVD